MSNKKGPPVKTRAPLTDGNLQSANSIIRNSDENENATRVVTGTDEDPIAPTLVTPDASSHNTDATCAIVSISNVGSCGTVFVGALN